MSSQRVLRLVARRTKPRELWATSAPLPPGYTIVGDAHTGAETVERALTQRPHLIAVDMRVPRSCAYDVWGALRERYPDTEALLIRLSRTPDALQRTGIHPVAEIYALRRAEWQSLLDADERGKTASLPDSIETRRRTQLRPEMALSRRETQVLDLLGQAKTSKEIGKMLGIAQATVMTHRASLMKKLCARNQLELMRWALLRNEGVR